MKLTLKEVRAIVQETLLKEALVYHGRCSDTAEFPEFTEWRPMFFTDKKSAKWYAEGCDNKSQIIYAVQLNYNNPASLEDLKTVSKVVGVTSQDMYAASAPQGDRWMTSPLYVKSVLEELEKRGFDAYKGQDEFNDSGKYINVIAVWHKNQIKSVKTHIVPKTKDPRETLFAPGTKVKIRGSFSKLQVGTVVELFLSRDEAKVDFQGSKRRVSLSDLERVK